MNSNRVANIKKEGLLPPSPTECLVQTYAFILNKKLVADDGGMQFLACQLGMKNMGSHELLKLMLDFNIITLLQIQLIAR